jgi:hypothetical protein
MYVIDAHHIFKTTKEKLDYVNSKVTEKPVTRTIFYRTLKKLDTNPKTQHYTNKGIFLMKLIELTDELGKIQKEIHNTPIKATKQYYKKSVGLDMKYLKIWRMLKTLNLTPHRIL